MEERKHGRELSDADVVRIGVDPAKDGDDDAMVMQASVGPFTVGQEPGEVPVYVAPVDADPRDLTSWTLVGHTRGRTPGTSGTHDSPGAVDLRMVGKMTPENLAAIRRSLDAAGKAMRAQMTAGTEALAKISRALHAAQAQQNPPRDPREAALAARRNRNTGPLGPRLDGRRR